MKKAPTIFLQFVVVILGVAALAFLLAEPHFEGRNRNATLFAIYFKDPFLAYVYFASTPFFMALYQAFRMLGDIRHNKTFTPATATALRTIRFCALAIIGFVVLGEIFIVSSNSDDHAGGTVIGFAVCFASAVVAAAAATLERVLQKAVDTKLS